MIIFHNALNNFNRWTLIKDYTDVKPTDLLPVKKAQATNTALCMGASPMMMNTKDWKNGECPFENLSWSWISDF